MKITILGSGESAMGAVVLAQKVGVDVFLSDNSTIKAEARLELLKHGVEYEENGHTERVFDCEEVIKSPGIPETAPVIVELRRRNFKRSPRSRTIPIISEIEFAMRYKAPKTKVVGITGSNGKTTTTLLIHHILTSAGRKAVLAGNIGNSLAREVARYKQPDYYVVELSSFQLDGMYESKLDVGILTNITPDHLDRYDHKMENYVASKLRIKNMSNNFIYNSDDPVTVANIDNTIKTLTSDANHNGVTKNNIPFDVDILPIKGLHNIYNAMQAYECAKILGLTEDEIIAGLRTFTNAPHRLEHVRTIDNVDYINDSKATNVDSAFYALQAQTSPVVWIAGGKDKGNDYNQIKELVRRKVKALVCLGKDNQKLIDFFTFIPVYDTHSIEECVKKCAEIAEAGDVVLLSPCCASFDLFNSYEDRGDQFKECVWKL